MIWYCLQSGIWRTRDRRWHAIRIGRNLWQYWREDDKTLRSSELRPIAGASGFCRSLRDVKVIADAWHIEAIIETQQLSLFKDNS